MTERVTPELYGEYNAFISEHPKGHFMQTRAWGTHKSNWKWEAVVCRGKDGKIKGSLAMLIRKIPMMPWSLMYGARGPVFDSGDFDTLAELISAAKEIAKENRAYCLKLDPDINSSDTECRKALLKLGFAPPSENKNFESVQPRYVFRIYLNGRTEDEIFNSFESKTRYNLRLACKKGVEVKICGEEMLSDFCRIMNETGERDRFIVRNEKYFKSMLDSLGENARLYMAFFEGKPIAGTIAIHFGDKVWYLYGASSNAHRNVMPNYLLQWEMIRWAIETGARIYDFRGVSGDTSPENPLYGLYRFKKGFSGEFTEFLGEFEMTFKPAAAKIVAAARKARHLIGKITD
ncbi:MAG: peptidoglycan bridge formation glycyltransferase FemA/FemB family protein [Clostridiales bacterium]|nr:peptidoglycan bridge formation glycyltransferase FemA/FemB family protein [Clostridiales bacterium]